MTALSSDELDHERREFLKRRKAKTEETIRLLARQRTTLPKRPWWNGAQQGGRKQGPAEYEE